MICKQCGNAIPRGQKYKSSTLSSYPWCSEDCYLLYVKEHEPKPKVEQQQTKSGKKPITILKDYINSIYPDPSSLNWLWLSKQIKSISEEYNLSYIEMGKVLKYAVEYEGVVIVDGYGLGQVFPRYIEPTMEFIKSIQKSRDMVDEIDDEVVNVVRVSKNKKRMWRERD